MTDIPGIVYVLSVVAACAFGVWWGRRYADSPCVLCDEPADLCPRCLDLIRDAFDHEDQERA